MKKALSIKHRPFGSSHYITAERKRPVGEVFWAKENGYGSHFYRVSVQLDRREDTLASCAEQWMAEAIVDKYSKS